MRSIYFHEDDYCQIEVLPIQNYNYCKDEFDKINDFSEEHEVEGGIGFTDIYVRNENPISILDLSISIDKICSVLEGVTCKYDKVSTGYSTYREKCQNTIAYGDNENVVIFFNFDKDTNFVKNIWLTLDTYNENEKESAKQILLALSKINELILVDWGWSFLTKLNNTSSIEDYLNERIEALNSL